MRVVLKEYSKLSLKITQELGMKIETISTDRELMALVQGLGAILVAK